MIFFNEINERLLLALLITELITCIGPSGFGNGQLGPFLKSYVDVRLIYTYELIGKSVRSVGVVCIYLQFYKLR